MLKTLGGDRLGSGKKMQVELHNYERSTHNLSNVFRTTAAPGVLIPFYKKLALNGDTWSIDLKALVRTMPAIGPLFGSYKLQLDIFECPIRLYNGVLHNNWTKIGMDMGKVKLPKIELYALHNIESIKTSDYATSQVSSSSLMAYLGVRGVGGLYFSGTSQAATLFSRKFNAVPVLAYYDIFKNYYANKQENKAFVVTAASSRQKYGTIKSIAISHGTGWEYVVKDFGSGTYSTSYGISSGTQIRVRIDGSFTALTFKINGTAYPYTNTTYFTVNKDEGNEIIITYKGSTAQTVTETAIASTADQESTGLKLQSFDLDNIDNMRKQILQDTGLGNEFVIDSTAAYPYKALTGTSNMESNCKFDMSGLVCKTYQSDIFNCWLSSDFVDGVNGINTISAVSTASGSFTIDALNLAKKVYNMLNRIAVSGGTYQDWQEAVYGEDAVRMAESPIYCGGMSGTIAFEEVVSTADTQTDSAGDQPLGSLAGKGTLTDTKGGHVEIHIKEPSYIMGLMSITPLVDYNQGNEFDMTELDSLNDLHKPALDQIGYQNLMLERAVWWGKEMDGTTEIWHDNAVGKTPAWIEYMTSYNQTYGGFAKQSELGWMVLNREYERGRGTITHDLTTQSVPIKDWTTYINPTKFNYIFADTRLEAQNFWVQIGINAIARRKMSAKIIPNL